jgi:hypothetical protein
VLSPTAEHVAATPSWVEIVNSRPESSNVQCSVREELFDVQG